MTRFKKVAPTDRSQAIHADITALVKKYGLDNDSAQEVLAVASYIVGELIAFQDQTVMTNKNCMDLVLENLQLGNKYVIEQTFKGAHKV